MTLPFFRGAAHAPADLAALVGEQGPFPDDREAIIVTHPDGSTTMWGPDEVDAGDVPVDVGYQSSMPGGFKGLSCNLFRGMRTGSREGLFDDVQVFGPGGQVRWEGRIQQMPASTDGGGRVTPQAVGWSAHLDDDATAREIYVDRELSRWGAVPASREQAILSNQFKPQSGGSKWDDAAASAGPVLDLTIAGYPWSSPAGRPYSALAYAAGGIPIGEVEYRHRSPAVNDPLWQAQLSAWSDLAATASTASQAVGGNTLTDGQLRRWEPPAGTRSVTTELFYQSAPAGTANDTYTLRLADVAVYGRHGLAGRHGRSYTGERQGPYGFFASAVIRDAISRWAPKLTFTTGEGGSITPTDYPIPHLLFAEHTTTTEIVERCNAFHQWDWAVWENRRFYFGPRGGGRTWTISTAEGLDLSLEGDTTDRIYNGVVVTYTDYAGTSRSVGPAGSGAEAIDGRLVSSDPTNPATVHGLRRWGVLALSVASDTESAATIGQAWLWAQATASRRGSATVTGWVRDEQGAWRPVSEVRAGDTLVVSDRPDDPPRRIIETSYSRAPRSNTLTLDSSAATLDAILERLGAALVGVL